MEAGSVLRMLQMVMTEATFAKGLKLYLEKMVEKSANSEDLWESMQSGFLLDNVGSTLSLPAIMRTWELQPGFPVVNVAINNNILTLTQERYHQNSKTDATGQIWSIPLSYATASNPSFTVTTPDVWLYEKTMTLESKTPKTWAANDWIIFNLQETGYYRVNYDLQLWKLLTDELTKGDITKFHTTNRAQLLDDSFNLARTDRLTYNVPLEIVTYLKKESDYIPWASFNRAMSFLQPYMMGSPQYHHFKQLILDNVDAFYTRLGATPKTNEKLMDRLGRNMAIGWACSMEHPKCLSDTKEQMEKVVAGTLIEPDLQSAMYCNGMRVASKATFDAIWASALVPDNEVLKSVILSGLGCSTDATLLKAFLDSSLMSTFAYTPEDKLQVLTSVYSNGGIIGYDMVITFMQETSLANIKR